MKTVRFASLAIGLSAMVAAMPAQAHFQLIYTPDPIIDRPGEVPLRLIFWHPMENGAVMDMGVPEEFFVQHREDRIDLTDRLAPITFTGVENTAAAYSATLPVRRSGDYVLALTPAPYFEESEDVYIQQITTAYLNRSTIPTDWMLSLDLPAEIMPMTKPTNVVVGSTFTGQVLSEGQPVSGVEIEVEFMAAEPDLDLNAPQPATASPLPGGTIVVMSDANGVFTFGIPRAGYWGFAALGVGPDTEHEGKELSQDAVIWIRAHDFD
ncbi:MAG: DUF4198 domain-containing protein [Pseudomonadota bacterium]